MKLKNLFKVGISLFAFFALVQATFAIGVSPTRTEVNIDPGQTKTITIDIFNETDKDMDAVLAEVEIFAENDEQGRIIKEEFADNDVRNIAKWITLPEMGFPLKMGETKKVTVTITAPEGAEPGGKYASILFFKKPVISTTTVTVVSRVASLLLINVSGDLKLSGEIERFELPAEQKSDETIPFSVVFKNTGNIHVRPAGDVKIVDKNTGKTLTEIGSQQISGSDKTALTENIPINPMGGNVLPGSNRNYISTWTQNYQNGKFTATAQVKFGEEQKTAIKQLDFEVNENINIDKFDINILPTSSNFLLTATNKGNIIERLTGFISITNAFGYEVSKIDIPKDIEYIKPDETKTYTFNWMSSEIPRGLYKATLHGKLGLTKADVTASVKFGKLTYVTYIIGGSMLLVILLLLFLLLRKKKKEDKKKDEEKKVSKK